MLLLLLLLLFDHDNFLSSLFILRNVRANDSCLHWLHESCWTFGPSYIKLPIQQHKKIHMDSSGTRCMCACVCIYFCFICHRWNRCQREKWAYIDDPIETKEKNGTSTDEKELNKQIQTQRERKKIHCKQITNSKNTQRFFRLISFWIFNSSQKQNLFTFKMNE